MTTKATPSVRKWTQLHAALPEGRVLSGAAYDRSRRVWNGAVTNRPAVIVRPESAAEVQACVEAARQLNVPLSVRSGGHDWLGRSLRHDGLVIDMSALQRVTVDAGARTATVQGGALSSQVIAATAPSGLAAATGMVGSVGMAGLTLGGGYGPLNGRCGLAVDNLLSAEIVLADGRLVTADQDNESELFWAIRGGGGNFGVVTSMRIRLHPIREVLAGFILYPLAQSVTVWSLLQEHLSAVPDELTVQTGTLCSPDGDPLMFVMPIWSGEIGEGQAAVDTLGRLGQPTFSHVAAMDYAAMITLLDSQIVPGRMYAYRTRTVDGYTPEIVAALAEQGTSENAPLSGLFVHHVHGAATKVPVESTAFGIRRPHYVIEIISRWEAVDDPQPHREWANALASRLADFALPGGYPNLLGPDQLDQVEDAYGANASRLCAAKARFDPDDVFDAIPLPARACGWPQ